MFKLVGAMPGRAGVSRSEFHAIYRDHAAVAYSVRGFAQQMRQYVQNFVLAHSVSQGSASHPIFGCSELWFDDIGGLGKAYADEDYPRLRTDELRFIDIDHLVLCAGEETEYFRSDDVPRFKLFSFMRRRPHVSPEAFAQFLREQHGKALSALGQARTLARAYVQTRATADAAAFPNAICMDAVDELWLDSPDDAERLLDLRASVMDMAQSGEFIDGEQTVTFVAQARVVPEFGRVSAPCGDSAAHCG